jgi:hypothetical protein
VAAGGASFAIFRVLALERVGELLGLEGRHFERAT